MTGATLWHFGVDPDRHALSIRLKTARDLVIGAHGTMTRAVAELVGPTGPQSCPGPSPPATYAPAPVIKRAISKNRAKKRSIDCRTYSATLTTKTLTRPPSPQLNGIAPRRRRR